MYISAEKLSNLASFMCSSLNIYISNNMACKIDLSQYAYVYKLYYENVILLTIFYQSVGLKYTFLSKIRLVIIWKTLILKEHFATMSSSKFCKTLDSICNCFCHFFLLLFVVAEDVSLTGGAAIQRIRLIDEEEQV